MELEEIVALSVKHNAGDLHLCSGHSPRWRPTGWRASPPRIWIGSSATSWRYRGKSTLRSALPAASGCPALESLHLPPAAARWLTLEDGLVLPAAANPPRWRRCSTPLTASRRGISSRWRIRLNLSIRASARSARTAPRSALGCALREDPDVILLGELRDGDTIRQALTAAETGHLVLATLHTRSAGDRSAGGRLSRRGEKSGARAAGGQPERGDGSEAGGGARRRPSLICSTTANCIRSAAKPARRRVCRPSSRACGRASGKGASPRRTPAAEPLAVQGWQSDISVGLKPVLQNNGGRL
ncbi:putative Twitching mobility protein|nr:putative Twitching mobility protein [Candidatus Pantoea persica]